METTARINTPQDPGGADYGNIIKNLKIITGDTLMKKLLLVFILLLGTTLNAQATDLKNDKALAGVINTNAVFDVSPGGKRLVAQLNVIKKTYEQLVDFGHKPKFVLAFRGGATKFLTKDDKYVPQKELAIKKKVQQKIKNLKEIGVVMELCGIAAKGNRVDLDDFLPGIEVVANGYISVIGYQSQGYNLVPIY
jgi:intracellular sulfur oxidation DsrE/DsrF family protein